MDEVRVPMNSRWWQSRWIPAIVVAAAIAAWPACNRNTSAPAGTAAGANLDFVLKNANGQDVRLADFKGKPLLLNFWATWCTPCKAEIPYFIDFSTKYKAQGFSVLGISVDDAPEDIRAFAAEQKITYPLLVGRDRQDVARAFDAQDVIPVSWLIRRDGTVQAKVTGIHDRAWFEQQILAMF
jgi:peroxiredoxin